VERQEKEDYIKALVKGIQSDSVGHEAKETAMLVILDMFEPFRKSLTKKFAGKGVDFDDICQVIDLKLIEGMYDYDESKDDSAIRHITSKARNGIFNFYKKEMNYFKEDRQTISIDGISIDNQKSGIGIVNEYELPSAFGSEDFDRIVEMIIVEEELSKLTDRQKEVIHLFFISDMTQGEIAEELNINQANVSRAKKRGLAGLKTNLNPSDEHDDKQ
jgi:RNA polymerase sigma factor (sigma-70 family)